MDVMDKLVALCANRGLIYPSSEIYGGIAGFWDYGPLGVELRNNVKNAWWQRVVRDRDALSLVYNKRLHDNYRTTGQALMNDALLQSDLTICSKIAAPLTRDR